MPYPGINWFAILVAGVVPMVLGALWYSRMLFAQQWMKLIGRSEEEIKKASSNPAAMYGVTFVGALVMAYIMDHLIHNNGSVTFFEGVRYGFALWLGFVVTTHLVSVTFEFRPRGLYYINIAYNLVCFIIMGGILAAWR